MHRLLQRQLRKYIANKDVEQDIQEFIAAVDDAYSQSDEDAKLLQRSLELMSSELVERNRELKEQLNKLQQTENEIKQTLSLMHSTLEASMEGVLVIAPDGKPQVFNQNFLSLWDLDKDLADTIDGNTIIQCISSQLVRPGLFYRQYEHVRKQHSDISSILELRDGRIIESDATEKKEVGIIWSFRDITEKFRQEERIIHQANHDTLTGLPNRLLLNDRIQHAIESSKRNNKKIAVFYLDLDGFKKINDSLGHDAGDCFLKEVAQRLCSSVRSSDTVARFGGDEFVVLLEELAMKRDVTRIAQNLLDAFKEPFHYQQHELYASTSIGVVVYPDDGEDVVTLQKNADIALYQAKDDGRNCFRFFTKSLEKMAKNRLSIESQLRQAIRDNEFEIFYQPIYNIASNKLISFEALIRWPQQNGYLSPEIFVPIAESTGLIVPLGDWIIDQVCQQIQQWKKIGLRGFYTAVNLSPRQFLHKNLLEDIMHALNKHGCAPEDFAIEITEGMIIDDVGKTRDLLNQFKEAGIRVCLDDFGTGYSSLTYLKNLPIDVLKIDRTFVKDITESKQNKAIAASIVSLGHNLDQFIVAEGVETETQLNILRDIGCDFAQGYLFGKPGSAEEIEAAFTDGKKISQNF